VLQTAKWNALLFKSDCSSDPVELELSNRAR
jgi:hypothetical protein